MQEIFSDIHIEWVPIDLEILLSQRCCSMQTAVGQKLASSCTLYYSLVLQLVLIRYLLLFSWAQKLGHFCTTFSLFHHSSAIRHPELKLTLKRILACYLISAWFQQHQIVKIKKSMLWIHCRCVVIDRAWSFGVEKHWLERNKGVQWVALGQEFGWQRTVVLIYTNNELR